MSERYNNNSLKDIKSSYFIKIIFSYLDEKIKLDTIKHNKTLQNSLDIKLINYKVYSGRYIIYESNGLGKEYSGYTDFLIFEGEYSNGKRNGKGKEYYDNYKIKFEGEYSNGKRNGKGKEYWSNGKLSFDGEYSYGARHGKGKEYNEMGELVYEGEW